MKRIKSQGNTWDFIRFPLLNVLVFVATALAAVPSAYFQADAVVKFLIIIAAALVFLALIVVGDASLKKIAPVVALSGLIVAILFLLAHDWSVQPADYGFINRLAAAWTALRPSWLMADLRAYPQEMTIAAILGRQLSQNVAGGLLAAFLPFSVVWALDVWRSAKGRMLGRRLFSLVCVIINGLALLLSSSRAAFLALMAASALWLVWRASARAPQAFQRWRFAGLAIILIAVLAVGGLALARSNEMIAMFDRTPGFPSAASRAQIAANALRLAEDFPLLGGGLRAFPGLYSTYMLAIPYYLFGYSHNLYLDVTIEQGVFGLLALLAIFVWGVKASIWAGETGANHLAGRLGQAAFIGLASLLLHGLADDAFYGEYGTPLLFVLPAVAAAAALQAQRNGKQPPEARFIPALSHRPVQLALAASALLAVVVCRRSLVAIGFANLGAVEMTQSQLADFPSGVWDDKLASHELIQAEEYFQQALAWSPENRVANQRLGLIAMLRWDFSPACMYLQKAYRQDPGHRGVVKNLGYCLAWTEHYQEALPYLEQIPEADQELGVYVGWWQAQGRQDLADRARRMQVFLADEDY